MQPFAHLLFETCSPVTWLFRKAKYWRAPRRSPRLLATRPTHGEMALIPIGPTAFAPTCVSIGYLRNCPQPDTHSSIPMQVPGSACCHSEKKQVHKDASILASRALTGRLRWLWSQLGSQSPLQLYKRCLSIFQKPLAVVRVFTHTHTHRPPFASLAAPANSCPSAFQTLSVLVECS